MTGIILPGANEKECRAILEAVHDPHDARERMDPEFVMMARCLACGDVWYAPRRVIRDANREHAERCEKRHEVAAVHVQVLYPKQ